MNQIEQDVRDQVSRAYAQAVIKPTKASCCGNQLPIQKGEAAKLAGYSSDELNDLPVEAVVNSFGCGNPLAFGAVQPGQVVLDLGSGAGIDLLLAAKKVGPTGRVIGVDMTEEMIEKARENITLAGLDNTEVRQGIIEKLPVESESVDWVISNCVINLSPEKDKVFAEIARVLKPGGRMLVSDIVVEDLPDIARKSTALYNSCVAGAISEAEYCECLQRAGLSDVEVVERIKYSQDQLKGFAKSECEMLADSTECCGQTALEVEIDQAIQELAGKVWSAKINARKPEA